MRILTIRPQALLSFVSSLSILRAGILGALLATAAPSRAATYEISWNNGFDQSGVVPDGNVTGWSDARDLFGLSGSIVDLDVTLDILGGWNGDLYAYLVHEGGFSVLLNRAGVIDLGDFGYGDSGLNIRFDDDAANGDFHHYQAQPAFMDLIANGSPWAPDGREANPMTVTEDSLRSKLLGSFNGVNPNGAWTLFVADLSSGDVSQVNAWGLHMTTYEAPPVESSTVPEAASSAWVLALVLSIASVQRYRARKHA